MLLGDIMVKTPIITNPKKLNFELYAGTSGRKLAYQSTYEYAMYHIVGHVLFFIINWRGKISEDSEKAYLRSEVFTAHPPMYASAFTICDAINIFVDKTAHLSGLIDPSGIISFEYNYGAEIANWDSRSNDAQYLKISGFYMFE